ncbi:MAG: HisA/HisF-related TIM barrel protein [Candidatus Thorarchaeota archaeon]|jgi:phosphoribosylformimino-5-aminoimidazole carboxamide ribotide isomerase
MKRESQIIPVIDIMNAQVVHGIAGMRERYEPIRSKIVEGSDPTDVAEAFRHVFDVDEIYVADLDAISGTGNNIASVTQIAENVEVRILLDAGVRTKADVERLLGLGVPRVIVATETIQSANVLTEIAEHHSDTVIGSLDLMNGKTLGACSDFSHKRPSDVARMMESFGLRNLIVLELALVGSGKGPVHPGLIEVCRSTNMTTIAGGGVRNRDDLRELRSLGVEAALVATALHNQSITL